MINKPSLISSAGMNFIVMDAPSEDNALEYAGELKSKGVLHLVRTCEGRYSDRVFEDQGIQVHEFYFSDGSAPPKHIIQEWLNLVKSTFFQHGKLKKQEGTQPCIAVHCLAGLGRAPVLVAIALIEAGLDPQHVTKLIRRNRNGALNVYQIKFLNEYKKIGMFQKSCCILL